MPLGEDREAYRVRVTDGGTVLREGVVTSTGWTYTAAQQAADAPGAAAEIAVAQISARYGAGPEIVMALAG